MEITTTRPESSGIIKSFEFIPDQITKFEQEIISLSVASEGNRKLYSIDTLTLSEKISNIVNLRLGYKPRSEKDEFFFLQQLDADCNKFQDLTEGEVLKFLEMGIDGYFNPDKDFYFTSSLFVKWGRKYREKIKEPAITKQAQLVHQIAEKKIEVSIADRILNASEIANGYAAMRRITPDHQVVQGASLYANLENYGIHSLPLEDKKLIYEDAMKVFSKIPDEEVRNVCQNIAYNKFIDKMVNQGLKLNQVGRLVNLNGNE